jgi:hypothetical protein
MMVAMTLSFAGAIDQAGVKQLLCPGHEPLARGCY